MSGTKKDPAASVRLFFCVLILLAGTGAMMGLKAMKTPPREATRPEQAIQVSTVTVQPHDVPVYIQGYGEVRSLNTVAIAPEVAGRIVAVHPRLEVGEVVKKGELLFAVDTLNYQAALDQAIAGVTQRERTIARLKTELEQDRMRFDTLKRNRELARLEFERVQALLKKNRVGTRSGVDKAEQTYNSALDQVDQMRRNIGGLSHPDPGRKKCPGSGPGHP